MKILFAITFYSVVWRGFALPSPWLAIRGEVSNNPTAENFLRRAFHATVVLGNYLYIDGGEFSQLVDGNPDTGQNGYYCRQNNFTLSIDLSSSWTNKTVIINTISKSEAPNFNNEVLWKTDANSFYSWGGEMSGLVPQNPPSNGLWKFTSSNGTGTGVWSQIMTSDVTFSELLRRSAGSGATIGETGYYIGGQVWSSTDPSATGDGADPQIGVVSFNSSSGTWDNETSVGMNTCGTVRYSEVVTIPAFGLDGRGLLITIGGEDPGLSLDGSNTLVSFSNITIYDPYIDRWFAQNAVGDVPEAREAFCAVAVQGDNGTYEIFVHAGINYHDNYDYDDVYVLTIPGFVWFQAPQGSGAPRWLHTCEVVGGRQLMVIGGLDDNEQSEYELFNLYQEPDPFTQGIGIFDMAAMEWMPLYNASAAPYESPEVVKNWYAEGNQESVQWQSKEVSRMFIRDSPVSVSPTTGATPNVTPTESNNSNNCDSDSKTTLALSIVTSFLGLVIAAASAWTGWKQYQQKRLKAKHLLSENKLSSAETNIADAEQPTVAADNTATSASEIPHQTKVDPPSTDSIDPKPPESPA